MDNPSMGMINNKVAAEYQTTSNLHFSPRNNVIAKDPLKRLSLKSGNERQAKTNIKERPGLNFRITNSSSHNLSGSSFSRYGSKSMIKNSNIKK